MWPSPFFIVQLTMQKFSSNRCLVFHYLQLLLAVIFIEIQKLTMFVIEFKLKNSTTENKIELKTYITYCDNSRESKNNKLWNFGI